MNDKIFACPGCKWPVLITLNKQSNLFYARCNDLKDFILNCEGYGRTEQEAYEQLIENFTKNKTVKKPEIIKSPNKTSDFLGKHSLTTIYSSEKQSFSKVATQPKISKPKKVSYKKLENFLEKT